MRIKVNESVTEVPDGLTITELLTHQKVKMPDMVSVQVNGTILKREDISKTLVRENDSVDFLYFMGGGVNSLLDGSASSYTLASRKRRPTGGQGGIG
jgi:sulfur carrier protein